MKFLTDAQARLRLVEMLRGIGWDVATVYDYHLEAIDDDGVIVGEARKLNRVFLSFDYMTGLQRISVARALHDDGGRMIRIGGGPQQPAERSMGKLLFHHETWYPWLETNEGKVEISDLKQKCALIPREQIRVTMRHVDVPPFKDYVERKEQRRKGPARKRRPKPAAPEQASMVLYGGKQAKPSK